MLPTMADRTIAISGSSGLVGRALTEWLRQQGTRVLHLVRRPPRGQDEVAWVPESGLLDESQLAEASAIVNLAGSNIGTRWSPRVRRQILTSRALATNAIVSAIERSGRPITLISGSAIGYYGSRGDELLTEESARGDGYLAEVCAVWENSAARASSFGARVVRLRTGVVLSNAGGALPQMLRPFRFGVGGVVGSGKQWLSWIDIDDMARAITFLIDTPSANGAFNLVAPNPVTNAEFTQVAADVMHRPAVVRAPEFALKLAFGEMAEQTLLASQRAIPAALTQAGFSFTKPTLRESLSRFV
jgi:uncharacterized protein (TIGR01777 family)